MQELRLHCAHRVYYDGLHNEGVCHVSSLVACCYETETQCIISFIINFDTTETCLKARPS
jgi:hypothetical protein